MSLVLDRLPDCPARSFSVSTASLTDGQVNPCSSRPVVDVRHGRLGRGLQLLPAGPQALAAQHLGQPLRRAVPLGDQDDPPAVREPAADVRDHAVRSAAIAPRRAGFDPERTAPGVLRPVRVVRRGTERLDRPPRQLAGPGRLAHPGDGLEGGGTQIDRRVAARRGVHPGRVQELPAGADQFLGPGADALGVAGHQDAVRRQVVGQQVHPVGQDRRERLHALDGDPVRELAEHLGQTWILGGQLLGPVPHRRRQQQFPAGRGPQAVRRLAQAALIGDLEVADLLDGVPEELDPYRMLVGG